MNTRKSPLTIIVGLFLGSLMVLSAAGCGSSEPEVKIPLADPNGNDPKPTSVSGASGGAPTTAGTE